MKHITITLLLMIPVAGVAQNYPGMTEADMQMIEKMQACIENVDQEQLQVIEQRQNQFDAEVRSLCGQGMRDEAQRKALAFEKEMSRNPALQAMSKCGELAKGMMPQMPLMNREESASDQHVCDSI